MEHKERIGGKNVALVMSGGNIDGDVLTKILSHY
jgi:threonine dehydratase